MDVRATTDWLARPSVLAFLVLATGTLVAAPVLAEDSGATLSLELGKIFTFFFLTLGPKAVIAPFASCTANISQVERRKVALATTGIALLSILIAATIGVRVLSNWGISSGALLIAAGIILFLIALDSIRDQYQPGEKQAEQANEPFSVRRLAFNLAFPYVVSPYGVAVVILVLTSRPAHVSLLPIVGMLLGIMLLNLLVMLNTQRIVNSPYIAPAFAILGAVLAVLQAALGIQAILVGLRIAGIVAAG